MDAEEPSELSTLVAERLKLPAFQASSSQFMRIETPRQFYGTLKNKIMRAKHRIFISTLYIGKEERELVGYLRRALAAKPDLQLTILMDAMRATRESPKNVSSASLVSHLTTMFPDQVDVRLYATPWLRPDSMRAKMVGKRFNEGFGLQHMKVYGFDDSVIISGANLSRDYFNNRWDRYMLIRNHPMLADYLHALLLLTCRFSYALEFSGRKELLTAAREQGEAYDDYSEEATEMYKSPFQIRWDGGEGLLCSEDADGTINQAYLSPPRSTFPSKNWTELATEKIQKFTNRWCERTRPGTPRIRRHAAPENADATIVPLLQMGPLQIQQETAIIPIILEYLRALQPHGALPAEGAAVPHTTVDITSGYFSLSGEYKSLVLSERLPRRKTEDGRIPVVFRLVAAAPESNGFYGSKGVTRLIPDAYTYLEKQFWDEVQRRNLHLPLPDSPDAQPPVELREWRKYGWTYHQKGIWITPPSYTPDPAPTVTILGSSNYGARSEKFDLECSLLITTSSPALRSVLRDDLESMRYDARDLMDAAAFDSKERKVGALTRFLTRLVKNML